MPNKSDNFDYDEIKKILDGLTDSPTDKTDIKRKCNDCAYKHNEYKQYTLNQGHCPYYLVYNVETVCKEFRERLNLRW
jgi:hypothetical protein